MDREFYLKLANATHRVADVLPQQGQIRNDIKSAATNIAAQLFLPDSQKDAEHTIKDIQSLLGYFQVAKSQKWIDTANFLILEAEYGKIIEFLENQDREVMPQFTIHPRPSAQEVNVTDSAVPAAVSVAAPPSLTDRQKKILQILKNKEKTQVWELQKVLPEVTKRTLRRDLDDLLQLNLVERQGEWNEVYYRLK